MASIEALRESVCRANIELDKHDLVVYTFGNVSGIDRDNSLVVIKPSGVPYAELTPENMVVVDMENKVVEGELRPSSDTKSHIVLYKSFPQIEGVVHTHSTYATAWAQAKTPIPCLGTTHADHVYGEVPCTPVLSDDQIKRDYEEETGVQIVKHFEDKDYIATPMVLVANHGPFTWGNDPVKAVYNSVVLEEMAKMALLTIQANPKIGPVGQAILDKHYFRKHGKDAYYGQK